MGSLTDTGVCTPPATPKWRDVDPRIPGSGRDLATQKRRLERQLRRDGWSRAAAVAEVARRYDADRT